MNPDEEKTNVITPAADQTTPSVVPAVPAPDTSAMSTDSATQPMASTAPDLDATGDAPSQSFDQPGGSTEVVSNAPANAMPTSVTPPDSTSQASAFAMPEQPAPPTMDSVSPMPTEQPMGGAPVEHKSGPKVLIVVLLAVILIAAGAAVAYFGGLFG